MMTSPLTCHDLTCTCIKSIRMLSEVISKKLLIRCRTKSELPSLLRVHGAGWRKLLKAALCTLQIHFDTSRPILIARRLRWWMRPAPVHMRRLRGGCGRTVSKRQLSV